MNFLLCFLYSGKCMLPILPYMINASNSEPRCEIDFLNYDTHHCALCQCFNKTYDTKRKSQFYSDLIESLVKLSLNLNSINQIIDLCDSTIRVLSYLYQIFHKNIFEMFYNEFIKSIDNIFPKNNTLSICDNMVKDNKYLLVLTFEQYNCIKHLKNKVHLLHDYSPKNKNVPIDDIMKDDLINCIKKAHEIITVFNEVQHFYLELYSRITFKILSLIEMEECRNLIEENRYLIKYYDIIKQIQKEYCSKFIELTHLYGIKENDTEYLENSFLILIHYNILKRLNLSLRRNKIFLCLLENDAEHKNFITKITALLHKNKELYKNNILFRKGQSFMSLSWDYIIEYYGLLNENIHKYRSNLKEIINEIYEIIHSDGIFKDEEMKFNYHLNIFIGRAELYFKNYIFLVSINEVYNDFFNTNRFKTKVETNNLVFYYWNHPYKNADFGFYDFLVKILNEFSKKFITLGLHPNVSNHDFSFFSNFDLWLENTFNKDMTAIIKQIKNIDANKFIKILDEDMFLEMYKEDCE